ncbi:MAG: NAD(P)-dependent oxidoreductase [Polyangiaceae bacterium]|nr:NAD(P)-dependent oxidoreductase [Polyangiaceae bacterium]
MNAASKILVTGPNGFLGVALIERLLARDTPGVVAVVRAGSDRKRLDAVIARHPKSDIQIVTGSLATVAEASKLLEGVGTILHLAAALRGPAAEIFLGTVVASKNLLEAIVARRERPRIVLVSSFGVYGVADLPKGHVVDESTPLEPHPERRDHYSHAKLRQEELFFEYHRKHGVPLTVLRPGAIYGPNGGAFSGRVGLQLPGFFLFLGGKNLLPLSYVDNCAEAICLAAEHARFDGDIYNVHDDELIDCGEYLHRYRRDVSPLRVVKMPYPAAMVMSKAVEWYHKHSRGQLPAIFTPYKTRTTWKGNRFSNAKLKGLGFNQLVSTDEGLRRTFEHLRASSPS